MCDTQVLLSNNGIWFGKNSDREPQEPQALLALPAVRGDTSTHVQTTYLRIPQVPDRHAVVLSKPCWIWGAEMGFNEHGLVIGNEAIFSRQRSLEPALLGMDMLRLALERCRNARAAIDLIAQLLDAHGQGGPAGYADKAFHYDSSFIIADPDQAWVMETAGQKWAAKRVRRFAAISNALSLEQDHDLSNDGTYAAFRRHDSRLMPFFAASQQRRALSLECLQASADSPSMDFARMAAHLRRHYRANEAPLAGSNRDLCMHALGPIRRSQTTGSLIVWLGAQGPRALATGTSAPCLSLYRPLQLGSVTHQLSEPPDDARLWHRWERVHRAALFDRRLRERLRTRINRCEEALFPAWMHHDADIAALDEQAQACSEEILSWPEFSTIPRRLPLTPARWRWRLKPDHRPD